jgi:hypothetical protein
MTTSTFGFCLSRAQEAMLRLCLGCILCSLIFRIQGAHAAQPDMDLRASGIDVASLQFTHYDRGQPVTDRFSARVGATDAASFGFRFGGTSSLPEYVSLEKITTWVASIRWHLAAENDRAYLSPRVRVESEQALIEIKPLKRSVWMMWHRALD